jgi:hypothetical protein
MDTIAADLILSEPSVHAGVGALERIHGRHLGGMSADEQAEARAHWREQVEQVLHAVHAVHAGALPPGHGRAVIVLADAGTEDIEVSVAFDPDLRQLDDDEVEGTPAQILALTALSAVAEQADGADRDAT